EQAAPLGDKQNGSPAVHISPTASVALLQEVMKDDHPKSPQHNDSPPDPAEDDPADEASDDEPVIRRRPTGDDDSDSCAESADSGDEDGHRQRKAATAWNNADEEEEMKPRARWHFWLDLDPPKMLGDVVEACIGAYVASFRSDEATVGIEQLPNPYPNSVFVDSGFSLPTVQAVLSRVLIEPLVDLYVTPNRMPRHPVTALHELAQARGCSAMRIDLIEPPHMHTTFSTTATSQKFSLLPDVTANVLIHGTLIATSKARNQKDARKQAAEMALEELCTKDQWWETVCTCWEERTAEKEAQRAKIEGAGEDNEEEEVVEESGGQMDGEGDEATVEEIPAAEGLVKRVEITGNILMAQEGFEDPDSNMNRKLAGKEPGNGIVAPDLEEDIDVVGL
ncbi:hypothetical protein HDU93_007015, partial [Gonapodya sp. JEL0774]